MSPLRISRRLQLWSTSFGKSGTILEFSTRHANSLRRHSLPTTWFFQSIRSSQMPRNEFWPSSSRSTMRRWTIVKTLCSCRWNIHLTAYLTRWPFFATTGSITIISRQLCNQCSHHSPSSSCPKTMAQLTRRGSSQATKCSHLAVVKSRSSNNQVLCKAKTLCSK